MGCGYSAPNLTEQHESENKLSKHLRFAVNQHFVGSHSSSQQPHTVIIVGGSGKTTFLKQTKAVLCADADTERDSKADEKGEKLTGVLAASLHMLPVTLIDLIVDYARQTNQGLPSMQINFPAGRPLRVIDASSLSGRRHCTSMFEMTSIVYFLPLTCYDQTLYEDIDKNEMVEHLKTIEEVGALGKAPRIRFVLLTKLDLFHEKIRAVPLSKTFPDFDGGSDSQAALQYMRTKIEKLLHRDSLDSQTGVVLEAPLTDVHSVWSRVQEHCIRRELQESGLT